MERDRSGIPDLLTLQSGEAVKTAEQWAQRRSEILETYQKNVFGRMPERDEFREWFEVVSEEPALNGAATDKRIRIHYQAKNGRTGSLKMRVFVPAAKEKPAPAFILILWKDPFVLDWHTDLLPGYWPVETLIEAGFCAASFCCTDCDTDEDDHFSSGVHAVFDDAPREADQWGAISAWAWGFSRVIDYMEQDDGIDSARAGVVGQSRGGKTALWAACCDPRIWMAASNDSGCLGAAIQHGNTGEQIEQIAGTYPFWFADRLVSDVRAGKRDFPFDQHMMMSLIAPRLLYVASATEDGWADPPSEFLGVQRTAPAYRLLNCMCLPEDLPMPPADEPVFRGQTGYHIRTGRHRLTLYDWTQFIRFARRHLDASAPEKNPSGETV